MALIGEMQYLTIGDNTYSIPASGGSTVQITRNLTSGTKSATITVDGTPYELFAPSIPSNVSSFTNDAGYITSADVPEGASAYAGTISAVGTSASTGSNNGFARGDHVHNLTKTTVDSVLGTGSGTEKFYREDGTWATPAYTTNTDAKVAQSASTSSTAQPILFRNNVSSGASNSTEGTRYVNTVTVTPSTGTITATKFNGYTLAAASAKAVDTSISTASTSANLPTSAAVASFVEGKGYLTSFTESDPTVPSWAKAESKPTYTASEVGALASNTTYVSTVTTTAGTHTAITNKSGAVSFNVPTSTSHLTNDSGFITSFTDVNVTNTAVTAATTYYLTGSTSSSTATGGLSKHAAIKAYVTANSGTGGSARIDLGNTTATTSAGGKEGIIRLYGTTATYYVDVKAGAPSANRTITFPNKTGTVALTDDIPTVSYPVTSVNNKTGAVSLSASDVGALPSTTAIPSKTSDLTNDSGFLTSYTETDPVFSASAAAGITSTDISNWNSKINAQIVRW